MNCMDLVYDTLEEHGGCLGFKKLVRRTGLSAAEAGEAVGYWAELGVIEVKGDVLRLLIRMS